MTLFRPSPSPLEVATGLQRLGQNIASARKRRRITTIAMAQDAGISRPTLAKIEAGDPAVSMGLYCAVLQALGLEQPLFSVAGIEQDKIGQGIAEESLPRVIRGRRRR